MKCIKPYEFEFKRTDSKKPMKSNTIETPKIQSDYLMDKTANMLYSIRDDKEFIKNKIQNLETRIRDLEKSLEVIEEFFKMYQSQQEQQNQIPNEIVERINSIQKSVEECKGLFHSNYFEEILKEKIEPIKLSFEEDISQIKFVVNTLNENYLDIQNEISNFKDKFNSGKVKLQDILETDKGKNAVNFLDIDNAENSEEESNFNTNQISFEDKENISDTEEEKFMRNIRLKK